MNTFISKTQILSAVLVLTILCSLIPAFSTPVSAASYTTSTQVETAIDFGESKKDSGTKAYSYLCLKFVGECFGAAGLSVPTYGYAANAASKLVSSTSTNPPRGAVVFWDWWGTIDGVYKNWGHVGISLGDGEVLHADYNGIKVTGLYIDSSRTYRGWGYWNNTPISTSTSSSSTSSSSTSPLKNGQTLNLTCLNGYNVNAYYTGKFYQGQRLCSWQPDGSAEQVFKVKDLGDGTYMFSVNGTSLYMDVYRSSSAGWKIVSGCSMDLWGDSDRDATVFKLKAYSDGSYAILLASNPNLAITMGSKNNTTLTVQTLTGATNQRFWL